MKIWNIYKHYQAEPTVQIGDIIKVDKSDYMLKQGDFVVLSILNRGDLIHFITTDKTNYYYTWLDPYDNLYRFHYGSIENLRLLY